MKYSMKSLLSVCLLLTIFVLGWVGLMPSPHALAAIRQLEEAPGQMVEQSRQSLKDQHGNSWQAIAFKRILPDGEMSFYLRLVGFPGVAKIDRSQPLSLTSSLGQTLTAIDVSKKEIFTKNSPESNVGQYDLQPLLPKLQAEIPWQLTLPTLGGTTIHLSIPPTLVQEWITVSAYKLSAADPSQKHLELKR